MKKTLLILTILLILFSCNKENGKSDFIGNWSIISGININIIDIQYFNDSIVEKSTFEEHYSTKWKAQFVQKLSYT